MVLDGKGGVSLGNEDVDEHSFKRLLWASKYELVFLVSSIVRLDMMICGVWTGDEWLLNVSGETIAFCGTEGDGIIGGTLRSISLDGIKYKRSMYDK